MGYTEMGRGGDQFERNRLQVADVVWVGVNSEGEVLLRCDEVCLYSWRAWAERWGPRGCEEAGILWN